MFGIGHIRINVVRGPINSCQKNQFRPDLIEFFATTVSTMGAMKRVYIIAIVLAFASTAQADLVRLKSGGELRGKVANSESDRDPNLTIVTLHGGKAVVPKADVELVTRRSMKIEEYELLARRTPPNIEAHLELAEWCRSQRLNDQREEQYREVLKLDPDHEESHKRLGHVFREGMWFEYDAWMESQGLVKYKGKFMTPQASELLEKTDAEIERERVWLPKVRLWLGWVKGRDAERASNGLTEFRRLDDPDAATAVIKFICADSNPQVRRLAVETLRQMPGPKPVDGIAKLAILDVDVGVRELALESITKDQYPRASNVFIGGLRHAKNEVVCRSALALGKMGDRTVIPALIDALTTSHRHMVKVAVGQTYAMGRDGSVGTSGISLPPEIEIGLRTGQYPNGVHVIMPDNTPTKTIPVTLEHKNAEVLLTLENLAGKSFGYDKRTWRLWWAAEKSNSGT